jgi:hypothetical protein
MLSVMMAMSDKEEAVGEEEEEEEEDEVDKGVGNELSEKAFSIMFSHALPSPPLFAFVFVFVVLALDCEYDAI